MSVDCVLRVVPSVSLAEDAMQDAVERLEEDVGRQLGLAQCPLYTQVELYSEFGRLTAIVQYDQEDVVAAMRSVRLHSVTVSDEDMEKSVVRKDVLLDVVRHGDESESPLVMRRVRHLRGADARPARRPPAK